MSGEKPMNQASFSSLVVPVLPAERLADGLMDDGAGAAKCHAFQHRRDLIGGHRIDDLLPVVGKLRHFLAAPGFRRAIVARAAVGPPDGPSVAVLDAVYEGPFDLLAAVDEHAIGRGQAHKRRFAGAQRHRQQRRQVVVDAETARIFAHDRHAHVLREPDGHQVPRFFDADAEGLRAVHLLVVVFRPPQP